jgi:hypothetical protein
MNVILETALVVLALGSVILCAVAIGRRRSAGYRQPHAGPGSAGGRPGMEYGSASRVEGHWPDPSVVPEPAVGADGSVSSYRVRPGSSQDGPRWDPYAEGQSLRQRIEAARRKPRPARSGGHGRFAATEDTPVLDHYRLLGVRTDATEAEIEAAYRRYAAEVHPDRFFGDPRRRGQAEEKLKQLNAIMQVLRDPERRAQYDASR